MVLFVVILLGVGGDRNPLSTALHDIMLCVTDPWLQQRVQQDDMEAAPKCSNYCYVPSDIDSH